MKDLQKYNYLQSALDIIKYEHISENKKNKIKNERLQNLLKITVERSPYYNNLYKNINIEDININNLEMLPTTTKTDLMKNFNKWIQDEKLELNELNNFLKTTDDYAKEYLNEYIIMQTSGTTGEPITVVTDKGGTNISLTISFLRTLPSKLDIINMLLHGTKAACILPLNTPCISTFLIKKIQNTMKNKNKLQIINIEDNISEIVKKLNEFQPVIIGGYCTFYDILLDEFDKGNLKIKPLYCVAIGEKLTNKTKERLTNSFKSKTLSLYATTETAEIAHMCKKGHYHLNDDWTIVECVDKNNNPIPDGTLSDKILVTNLWNYTQPFIRYEINDRCIMHHEKCSCGHKSPWIEIEGRTFSPIEFKGIKDDIIKISPISLELLIHKVDDGINRYQIEIDDENINFRITEKENYNKTEIFKNIKEVLEDYLFENNIKKYNINILDENPIIDKSGKFRQIYQKK